VREARPKIVEAFTAWEARLLAITGHNVVVLRPAAAPR
jgi:hypothetical protein